MNSYMNLCTQYYDIDKPGAPQDEFNFYLRYVQEAGGPILEPMCGSGRFLVPLRDGRFDIDGVDASPHMLAACRAHLGQKGLTADLYQQPLHQLEVSRRFALVMIPAGSFGLITDPAEARESLLRVYESMLPGARLVLDVERQRSPVSFSWPWGGRWVERPDGAKIVISWLGHYDVATRISHSIHRFELVKDARLLETEFEDFDLRYYEPEEFAQLLENTGFRAVRTWKAHEFRPPEDADEAIVFECVKP